MYCHGSCAGGEARRSFRSQLENQRQRHQWGGFAALSARGVAASVAFAVVKLTKPHRSHASHRATHSPGDATPAQEPCEECVQLPSSGPMRAQ